MTVVTLSAIGAVTAAPDPVSVRIGTLDELQRLGVSLPPPHYPFVWDPGDEVALRRPGELAARCAILGIVLATRAGLPRWQAMRWLRDAQLLERVTPPEWRYVAGGVGNPVIVGLAADALHGLAWLLGVVHDLDPILPASGGLARLLPDPWSSGRDYPAWRAGLSTSRRDAADAAALLDLYYCLDWSYQQNQQRGQPMPGPVSAVAIGARRWALEWGVVLHGPYHTGSLGWEDVDLSV